MAFDVVIAGGGFGGLYAARRLEPRPPRQHEAVATMLGHPPSLHHYLDEVPQSGEAPDR